MHGPDVHDGGVGDSRHHDEGVDMLILELLGAFREGKILGSTFME